ncbi:MAG: ATP-binding cassette domain-containing protein, partial [Bdellovibrionales bacterium]|nr:ATP-binding cassette domain-containing protein [Bdellovibrionales bacterium]
MKDKSKEEVLSIRSLSKSYISNDGTKLDVLKNISFDLYSQTVTSILGASGCGKTTLLRMLSGLENCDSGDINSKFFRPGSSIGYLQQSEKLLPWRTVLDNVTLGLELLGIEKKIAEKKALGLLDRVGMKEFASSFTSQISGGMTQRTLLARTLITEPKLLLLDEPLGQLDIVARRDLAKIIREYAQEKSAAVLLMTHSVEEAVFISDIVFTLSRRPAMIVERFEISNLL